MQRDEATHEELEQAARRRRGVVIAAVAALLIVPVWVFSAISNRRADERAERVVDEVENIADELGPDELETLIVRSLTDDAYDGKDAHDLFAPVAGRIVGSAYGNMELSVTFEAGWGMANRCIHVLIRAENMTTDVTSGSSCDVRLIS